MLHPWLYTETARDGLGIPCEDRRHVVGIENSGAGIVSILLAGFALMGIGGGNIIESGTHSLCQHYAEGFPGILSMLI